MNRWIEQCQAALQRLGVVGALGLANAGWMLLITNVALFDVYAGDKLPEGKKSLALEVTFQPRERTLTDAEIEAGLAALPGWAVENGKLHRMYKFPNFALAMGFMMAAAPLIEKKNHHPEWSNVYRTVDILLTSHDVKGLSERDVALARVIDQIAADFSPKS